MSAASCPSTERLVTALRGAPSCAEDAELAAHLAGCPSCQARLEQIAGGSGWLETKARAHAASAKPVPDLLARAMRALESRSTGPEGDTLPSPALDFLQPSDQSGALGHFGSYEVLEQVASGGMGIVLKARDPGLDRIVALKILPPARASNSLARARFIREARAAAAVVHEHVVPIYAVDEHAGLPYLVMQFIQGRSLAERLRASGPLRLEELLRIGAQTAAGLAAAHAQGLIHRDVKPGNILLENSVERVKLTDFGLARVVADDSSLTHEGHIAGTPEYMSPEQAQGRPVDARSDLFSLGCVLYEMATGTSPFHAEMPVAALRRVCDESSPPVHKLNPALPEWLGHLIARLMMKDAAARPGSAAEVAAELEQRLAQVQQSPGSRPLVPISSPISPPHRPAPKSRLRTLLLILLVPTAIGLALFWLKNTRPESALLGPFSATPPAAETNVPRGPLFFLPAAGALPERGFATLGEAVSEAANGSVIECRFNGSQPVESVRRIDKALILRAGPGFEPVLTPKLRGDLMLFTHAPLVLEGLTVRIAPDRAPARTEERRGAGIAVQDAPLLLAHCRLEIEPDNALPDRRRPNILVLRNVPSARLLNCELFSREGFILEWLVEAGDVPENFATELWVRGCVLHGNGISRGQRSSAAYRLELRQNTLAGDVLLRVSRGGTPAIPTVIASGNLLDFQSLLRPFPGSLDSPLETLVRWHGATNVFSVADAYAVITPVVADHPAWLASRTVAETNSFRANLGLRNRLASLTSRAPAAEAAAFSLTPEERQQLAAQGLDSSTRLGADPNRIGPGQPYHDWRNSPAYEEWLKLVREHIPTNAAGR